MKGFSTKTQLNKEFKLTDLAKSLSLSKIEKEELKQVESVTLANALNNETTGLKATDNVQLIYIFCIKLKSKTIPYQFLKALDKKTKAHTLFEVMTRDSEFLSPEEAKMPHLHKDKMWNCRECLENCGAAYTYIMANKKVADTITCGEFCSRCMDKEGALESKNFDDLEELDSNLLAFVIELDVRKGESPQQLVDRKKKIAELQKEITKLERKKNNEVQFNKRVNINDKIRELKKQLEENN